MDMPEEGSSTCVYCEAWKPAGASGVPELVRRAQGGPAVVQVPWRRFALPSLAPATTPANLPRRRYMTYFDSDVLRNPYYIPAEMTGVPYRW